MASKKEETAAAIVEAFKRFDKDGDGTISRDELAQTLRKLGGARFDDATIDLLMASADTNGDGKIQYEEFTSWVMADAQSLAGGSEPQPSVQGPTSNAAKPEQKPKEEGRFAPLDKRGSFSVDFRTLLPSRFEVDITSRFSLDKLTLGEGGYGKVFVAVDREMPDRKVAIKMVTKADNPKLSAEEREAEAQALDTEIKVMKELDHPHICRLMATFEEKKTMFFVMELCEGGELFDRIIESGKISEKLSADVIRQVSSALVYTHGRGIAHRDLKPENVVFCSKRPEDTSIKVIDWGLAMSFTGTKMTGAVGSFTYAAPEVITSNNVKEYTSACDLWSLGVMTYVMMSGKPPFWGSEKNHLRNAKQEKYPMDDHQAPWKDIKPEGKDFIKKLIKANPAKRMSAADCVKHPWPAAAASSSEATTATSTDVLSNLKRYSNASTFSKMCITAVARQLSHRHLKDVHAVFRELDANGDGVLSFQEISNGFKRIFGADSVEYAQVGTIFKSLDLDGSQTIDYTEFCAAGFGEQQCNQDEVLWAAFKTFDVDNSGSVDVNDLQRILDNADVQDIWHADVCREVAKEVVDKFARDKNGKISFEDWKVMMQQHWKARSSDGDQGGEKAGEASCLNAYQLLMEVNKLA
eukprot:TRINITY_DN92677_c0_g1_i1.p1 TRINITY_DN92677_c0_g1~~TRINITY_DN92677_c0_g1_i1.p1  ORF type:complete len:637 (+),score=155.43 TRINITY_DN92677_c0_g1_i1:161-2071(+)